MFKAAVVLTVALSCWALFASEKAIELTEASRIAELSVQLDKHDFDEVAKQIRRAPRLALSRDVLGEGLLHKAAKNFRTYCINKDRTMILSWLIPGLCEDQLKNSQAPIKITLRCLTIFSLDIVFHQHSVCFQK